MKRARSNAIGLSIACAALLSSTGASAAFVPGPRAVGAFHADDDGSCHAVAASASGDITDVAYSCMGGAGPATKLAHMPGAVAVSAYFDTHDHFRHAIVGMSNGDLMDIRYKPGITPQPIRLSNLHGFGNIKSLSAWTDAYDNQNVAVLTTWLASPAVVVWQQAPGQPGDVHYLDIFNFNTIIDLTGEYVVWDHTNKIEMAVGAAGAPSTMRMISWDAAATPDQFDMTDVFAPPTPWVTNFPGPDSRTQESIVSLSGTIGYYSDYTPWASPLLLLFVDTLDALKSFSVSNGGGLMTSSSAIPVGTAQSVAGPYVTGLIGGPIAAMQAVIGLADGRLFALTATQPGNVNAPPVWHYRLLGSF